MKYEDIQLTGKEYFCDKNSLAHYRMGGEKKGVRRWQNPDGSLTPEGREHYGVGPAREKGETHYDAETNKRIFNSDKPTFGEREIDRLDVDEKIRKKVTLPVILSALGMSTLPLAPLTKMDINTSEEDAKKLLTKSAALLGLSAIPMITAAVATYKERKANEEGRQKDIAANQPNYRNPNQINVAYVV